MACTVDDIAYGFSRAIRGHHVHKTAWAPSIGGKLQLSAECRRFKESFAVGHAPNCAYSE